MYHEMSSCKFGKINENRMSDDFDRKWFNEILALTDTKKVLTRAELKLGETSEVWLTGSDLIERKAVMDYQLYLSRVIPTRIDDAYLVNDRIYVKNPNGNGFVAFAQDKNVTKPVQYCDLINFFNEVE